MISNKIKLKEKKINTRLMKNSDLYIKEKIS